MMFVEVRSEHNIYQSALFFHLYEGSRARIQVVRLAWQMHLLYPLNHLAILAHEQNGSEGLNECI